MMRPGSPGFTAVVTAILAIGFVSGTAAVRSTIAQPAIQLTSPTRVDGAIDSLTLITRTARSEYFQLTYWSDGLRVTGFLGRPRDARALPAVVYNRGGNREFGRLRGAEIVPFVEAGFVAVASQYRGNAGSEGREESGGTDVNDALNLALLLQQLPEVDPERIGMMGHSRGGMMTYLALKRQTLAGTRHLKAAVTVGGVADLVLWSQERPEVLRGVFAPLIGEGPAATERYRERSATYWPELINAPLLILHGEADRQVSVGQSRKLARALADAGKTVELVTFPDGDHGLSRQFFGYAAALKWFQRHLGKPQSDHSFESHQDAIVHVQNWFRTSYRRP